MKVRRIVLAGIVSCLIVAGCATWMAPEEQSGVASWYGPGFHGNKTASGEVFDMHARTAAHRTLPFGTLVRVTRLDTGASTVVRINDRGPTKRDRVIDLSNGAAQELNLVKDGLARVRIDIIQLP